MLKRGGLPGPLPRQVLQRVSLQNWQATQSGHGCFFRELLHGSGPGLSRQEPAFPTDMPHVSLLHGFLFMMSLQSALIFRLMHHYN
jgi:hypothetical protein